jgi:hypothetical protein
MQTHQSQTGTMIDDLVIVHCNCSAQRLVNFTGHCCRSATISKTTMKAEANSLTHVHWQHDQRISCIAPTDLTPSPLPSMGDNVMMHDNGDANNHGDGHDDDDDSSDVDHDHLILFLSRRAIIVFVRIGNDMRYELILTHLEA